MEFLLFGGLLFWIAAALVGAALLWTVETEAPVFATVIVLGSLAGLEFFSDIKPFTYAVQNPFNVTAIIGAYMVAGVVWSLAKWGFYVRRLRTIYEETRARFLRNHSATDFSDPQLRKSFLREHPGIDDYVRPAIADNKHRVILWMSYWPISAVWTIINDPLKQFFLWAYTNLGFLFDAITKSISGKYADELKD